jgi:hypothetical protein
MAYLVNQTNGTLLATVVDGAVDHSHAGIALIGRKVTNYGELQNENYVRIAENFASPTSPTNPLIGQLWWNSAANSLNVFTGGNWVRLALWFNVPTSKKGTVGDSAGMMAVDTTYLYMCTGSYNGTADIWTRTTLSQTW